MKVEVLEETGSKIIAPEVAVTLDNCQVLLRKGKDLASDGFVDVIVDFRSCDFIDSAGIGTLISLSKVMKDSGGSLQLRNLSDNIRRVLSLSRLDSFFRISASSVG